ncbi:MAG: hypothetical protein ACM31C_10690 [Acidobacteriota bacterium]
MASLAPWRFICLGLLAACEPSLDQRLAIVKEPRVLAIVSEPAEAKPGAAASYSIVIGSPDGPLAAVPAWSLCTAPKPPTEDNAVSAACTDDPSALAPLAGPMATIPSDACTLFGPDVPPGGFRPRDPDPTGGYYQPVLADASDAGAELAFGFTRITCNLPAAPPDVAHDYQTMYVANHNPTLDPPQLPAAVPASSTITLVASWPADAAESYLYFDVRTQALVTRRESMRVSWFATGGTLAVDASAVAEDDAATEVSTTWRTPATPGPAWLWFVLRDSRGGIATQAVAVTVR